MGKGAGCMPSKSNPPRVLESAPQDFNNPVTSTTTPSADAPPAVPVTSIETGDVGAPPKLGRIYIIYYSMYGHVEALAKKIKEGVDSVEGIQGFLFRVPETLSADILEKMHAPPTSNTVPIISPSDLPAADAFLFGFPTRYGTMSAQMKAFFDATGQLWQKQQLAGKAAGFFLSTGTQGGGQETTAWTAITQLVDHGMLFIPIGYTFGAGMFKLDDIRGGSAYGAGTFAGDGSRFPSEAELQLAQHQGQYTAAIVKRLVSSN